MKLRLISAAAMLALGSGVANAQTAPAKPANTEAALAQKLEQLAAELADVKAQLAQMKQERAVAAQAPAATASAPAAVATADASASASPRAEEPSTVLTSYGELNYNRPNKSTADTQADVRRFVLGYQHRFDAKNKVVTELEVEHAVSSASDPGEVEVEQAYLEHQINPTWAAKGGLFLMPVGLLNENHEPTAFYGVERNFVETAIIPSTWREGGLQVVGTFDNGITLQTGLSTGFDLNKWDATSTEGAESPLGSIHQEMALAKARDPSVFAAVNWRGIPGLQLGGSLFTGKATQGQSIVTANVTLWDLHARYMPGRWDLSALYSRGQISNTAELNTLTVGGLTPIPKTFDGGYVQAAYKLWTYQDYALAPFARLEFYNTGKSYEELPAGLTPDARATEHVFTLGANFQLTPGVVIKTDIQRFRVNSDANRFDLGLGWSF